MYLTRIKNSSQHFHISFLETSELAARYSLFEIKVEKLSKKFKRKIVKNKQNINYCISVIQASALIIE